MKKLLIISPHFPPVNAADMHRIRTSLPYFEENGWEAEVVVVKQRYVDLPIDNLLLESLPENIKIHQVSAFSKKTTSKFGLGSLALRSMYFYKKYIDKLLEKNPFDLIYFSTTEFPLCVLGAHWKKKFNIPFVIDIQDPWHSEYYQDKPKNERPPKYWFSYNLHRLLEPIAMKKVSGLISVSEHYIDDLQNRYSETKNIPTTVITFAASDLDGEIAEKNAESLETPLIDNSFINLVYVGRGGFDMQHAAKLLFKTFKRKLDINLHNFKNIRFYFIGTSYAPNKQGIKTISPIAKAFGIEEYVLEQTDRISYFHALAYLKKANGLIIVGSDDASYTASKIYPYILAAKPLLAVFNAKSSAAKIIATCNAGMVADVNNIEEAEKIIEGYLSEMILAETTKNTTDWDIFSKYTAKELTKKQCELFNAAIS
ncbi:hypothetical protein ACVWYG_001755 [Pedobacter sp. UYEF25]